MRFVSESEFILHVSFHTGAPNGYNFDFMTRHNMTQRIWGTFINKTNQAIGLDSMLCVEVLTDELISFVPDFTMSTYLLLYKANLSTGEVTVHKKIIYDTVTVIWDRNFIESHNDLSFLSLGMSTR